MASKRVDKKTVILPGQYINKASMMVSHICGRPRKVVKASNSRVYYCCSGVHNPEEVDEGDYCSIAYVCYAGDTKEEAQALYELGEKKFREMADAEKVVHLKYKEILSTMIS